MHILITGGCGFIGLNLFDYLMNNTDWNVTVLDNLSVGRIEDLKNLACYDADRIQFVKGDIRNPDDISHAINDCSDVVHLAAQTDVIKSIEDPYEDAETNIMGTINLLNVAKQHHINCFVQASSAAPLGEQDPPVDENKVPQPLSGYGASKLSCEGYCSAFTGSYGLHTVALRFSNVYGPYSFQKGSVIAKFIRQIINHEPVTIFGDGDQTRDFVHASDIAQAIYLSLTNKNLSGFSLFQIGTGVETSINSLFETITTRIKPTLSTSESPRYEPARPGEIIRNYCEISHAVDTLGFQPKISIEQGIADTVNWFVDHYYQTQSVVGQ